MTDKTPKSKSARSTRQAAPDRVEKVQSRLLQDTVKASQHEFHRLHEQVIKLQEEAIVLEAEGEKAAARKIRLQAEHINKDLESLQATVAKAPMMAEVLGLGVDEPEPMEAEAKPWVVETKLKTNDVEPAVKKRFGSSMLGSTGPINPTRIIDGKVVDDPKLSKLRIQIGDKDGKMAPNATYTVVVNGKNEESRVVKEGRTDKNGYSSLSFGHISLADISNVVVSVHDIDNNDEPVQKVIGSVALANAARFPEMFFIPTPKTLVDKLLDRLKNHDGPEPAGTIEDPDEFDLEVSPDSFGLNEVHVDGNCCLRPNKDFAAKEYYFKQTVRLTDIEDVNLVFSRGKEVQRKEVQAPLDYLNEGVSTYAILGGNLLVGLVNTYKHAWYPAGRGLGRLLYSTTLAPCEEINLAFIDWTRSERDRRSESRTQSERAEHDLQHDRSIDEVVDATLSEHQEGSSSSGGGGASLDLGIFSIGGGGGATTSSSSGRRNLHSSTVQNISQSVSQHSSSLRHQRATVVTSSYQRESERIKTRAIHNHNKNHMMNLEYFQVVEHYKVRTELVEEKPVLLIPYQVDQDIFGTIASYNKYVNNPSVPITRFLDRHQRILSRMVPRYYRRSFQALSRLLHCRDIYDIEQPYATFSRWEIKLNNAWRKGVSLRIETHSGQSVKLYPEGGSSSNPPTYFRSTPVKDSDIKAITVNFDASESMQNVNIPGFFENIIGDLLDDIAKFKLEDISMSATTDRSRFLSTPQTFMIESSGVNTTLSSDNPSITVNLTAPTPDFSSYRGREHEDYCRLKELIAHIQSNPMRYMRAIWLSENPDRRAIRFDQYKIGNKSLLDYISNRPRGILGNYVAFELLDGHRLVAIDSPDDYVVSNRVVTLPTRGVFGEVFLSCCNATEKRDVERFIDPEQRCQKNAPEISGVSPGSRASRGNTTPTDFAAPIVNLQTAPSLPDPTGMANATSLLGTPDIFRDMSNASELLQFIDNATKEAFTSTRQHRAAMDNIAGEVIKGLVSAYTGVPITGGGSQPQAAQSGTTGITSSPSAGGTTGAQAVQGGHSQAGSIVSGELVRQTSPAQLSDNIQTIQKAVGSGQLTQDQGNAAINQLVGNTGGVSQYNPNQSSLTLIQPSSREGLAFNPQTNDKSNEITLEVDVQNMPTGGRVEWSCIDSSAVSFTAPDQTTTQLIGLKPGLRTVTCTLYDASNTMVSQMSVPLSIPQFIRMTEDTPNFNTFLTNFGLTAERDALLQLIKSVTERTLSTSNARLIWEMAPFNEMIPAVFSGAGLAFGNMTTVVFGGPTPIPLTPGITLGASAPNDVGANFFNETIGIFPGALDDPSASVSWDDALQQVITATNVAPIDATQQALKMTMTARFTGVVLAHEIVHSLIGLIRNPNGTLTPHNSPAIPGCLMNTGAVPSIREVTGIDINDMGNFPGAGSFTDAGIAALLLPSAHVQTQIDSKFPVII